jgi:phage-related protein
MSSPGGSTIGRVSVKVVPDTSKFKQELEAQLKKTLKDMKVSIDVEADTAAARAELEALKKKIDSLDKTVRVRVNKDDVKGLKDIGGAATSAGEGFSSMSRFALIGVAVLVLLAPALALIATLLAGLPSLLFLAGGAFAAVALGMDGITKAAEVFGPSIESLKNSLSATFEQGLTPVFEQLNSVFPVLERGLNVVAEGLVSVAQGFTNVVTSSEGMAQIENFLNNTGQFFQQITPGIESLTRTLLTLASAGAESFGKLADVFNTFTKGFDDMIQEAVKSGTLFDALDGLAKVTGALLDVFTKLFGAGLDAMGVLGGPIADLFKGFGDALVSLMPALTKLSEILFNVLGKAFEALVPIFDKLTPAFLKLADIFGELVGGALDGLSPLLETIAKILGDTLLKALTALEPFIEPLLNAFKELALIISEKLMQAFTDLMPLFDQIVKFVTDLLTAITPLLPSLIELGSEILQAIIDVMKDLMPHLMRFAEEVLPLIIQAIKDLTPFILDMIDAFINIVPAIADLVGWIIDNLVPAFNGFLQIVKDVMGPVKDIIKGVIEYITGVIDAFIGLITGDWGQFWDGIQEMAKGAVDILGSVIEAGLDLVIDFFLGLPLEIIGSLGDTGKMLADAGRKIVQGLIDGIKSMIGAAGNAIKGVVDNIRSFLPFSPAKQGPFSGRGWTTFSGAALVEGFAEGIRSAAPDAISAIEDVAGQTQAAMDIEAAVQSDGFGSISDKVAAALSGWSVEMDANGLTRMVNKTNNLNKRR